MKAVFACKNFAGHFKAFRVTQRNQNRSAFNGYRPTYSAYSEIVCLSCGSVWRTKAGYIASVPDMSAAERQKYLGGVRKEEASHA